MDLSQVVNISGRSGLYKIVAQSAQRIIVESLEDGRRLPVFPRDNFSILQDISIFTYDDNVPLEQVFRNIYEEEGGQPTIDHNSKPAELVAKMEEVLPDYDKDNVYPSDMKKLFKWYNLLVSKDLWSPSDVSSEEEE